MNSSNPDRSRVGRHPSRLFVFCGLLLAALVVAAPLVGQDSEWSVFRGDAQSTGVAAGPLPERLELLWEYEVPNGAFESTPVVADGVVYLGDLDGVFYALRLSDGTEKWRIATESGFLASAAVRDDMVYVGDMDGRVYALDAGDGSTLWTFDTQAGIYSSPNFYQDRVLVGSQDATLYCLDAESGELRWEFQIDDQIRCTPTVVENYAFVAGCDGRLHVIDLETGEASGEGVDIGAPTGVTPAVQGDLAFFGTEGGEFFGVNWRKREVAWVFRDPARMQPFRSSPAATPDVVVTGGRGRQVRALQSEDGVEVWTFATRQAVDSSPVIVGDRVFVGAVNGVLYELDLSNGDKKWEFETRGGILGSPAVAGGRLLLATDEGMVYCLGEN